jgi:PEP-CTERM motif
MTSRLKRPGFGAVALWIVFSAAGRVDAGFQLINNGTFEGGLSGWTVGTQPGSTGGWFSQTGTTSPLTGSTVQPPPGSAYAAMSDGVAGSQVLYQNFTVPQGGIASAVLSLDLSIANQSRGQPLPFNPLDTLDYTISGNRQARIDILAAGSDPFSMNPSDVLLNLYKTAPGDPNFSGYSELNVDLTAFLNNHAGQTLELRFAEVNSPAQSFVRSAPLNFGVAQVGLVVSSIPEPSSLALLAFGTLGLVSYGWRRGRRALASGTGIVGLSPSPSRAGDERG